MGNIATAFIGTMASLFIALTTVAAVNGAKGKLGHNQNVTISNKEELKQKVKEQLSSEGWKDRIIDADGRYNFFKILGAPADALGNTIGLSINYLINNKTH